MYEVGAAVMPPKKSGKPKSKMGRPKVDVPMVSIAVLRGSPEYAEWVDVVMKAAEAETRNGLLRRALRDFAKAKGVARPMPER